LSKIYQDLPRQALKDLTDFAWGVRRLTK